MKKLTQLQKIENKIFSRLEKRVNKFLCILEFFYVSEEQIVFKKEQGDCYFYGIDTEKRYNIVDIYHIINGLYSTINGVILRDIESGDNIKFFDDPFTFEEWLADKYVNEIDKCKFVRNVKAVVNSNQYDDYYQLSFKELKEFESVYNLIHNLQSKTDYLKAIECHGSEIEAFELYEAIPLKKGRKALKTQARRI